jgi:hypothetical protein
MWSAWCTPVEIANTEEVEIWYPCEHAVPYVTLKVTVYAFEWQALFFVLLAEGKKSVHQIQLFLVCCKCGGLC